MRTRLGQFLRILPVSRLDAEDTEEEDKDKDKSGGLSSGDIAILCAAALSVVTVAGVFIKDLLDFKPEIDEDSRKILDGVRQPTPAPTPPKERNSSGLLSRLTDFVKMLTKPSEPSTSVPEKGVAAPQPAPKIQASIPSEGGSRKKFTFSGFTGAEGISNLGRFTDQEAALIVNLKNRNADTSPSLKNRPEIVAKVRKKAAAAGLDADRLLKIMFYESGGNPNAISSTGAVGLFQFTGATASAVGVKNRFDIDQNIDGAITLYKENTRYLGSGTLSVYMVHQIGPAAAKEVMRVKPSTRIRDLSKKTQQLLKNNNAKGAETVGQYLQRTQRAMDERMEIALELPKKKDPVPADNTVVAQRRPSERSHPGGSTTATAMAAPRTQVAQSAVEVSGIIVGVN